MSTVTRLRDQVIAAHGGFGRWNALTSVEAHLINGGVLWAMKKQAGVLDDVNVHVDLHREFTSHFPFGRRGLRSAFTADRVAIESDAGGFTPRGMGLTGSEEQYQKFLGWRSFFARYGATDLVKGGGGADIGPLNRALGTPTASLNPDSQRYFDIHHSRSDTFETVNKRELELGAVNMAVLIYLVDKYGL
jgi:hypothetical protein